MNIIFQDGPEALAWLRYNGHKSALAHNRFRSTARAIAFIEQLYAAGAKRVFVPADSVVSDEEELEMGGQYSDHLVVELHSSDVPPDLERIYRSEATIEGWRRGDNWLPIINNRYLLLWWD